MRFCENLTKQSNFHTKRWLKLAASFYDLYLKGPVRFKTCIAINKGQDLYRLTHGWRSCFIFFHISYTISCDSVGGVSAGHPP